MSEALAWAAGFYDGEGNLSASHVNSWNKKHQKRYRQRGLHMSVGQKTLPTLERFKEAVGVGRIAGPYRTNSNTEAYYWKAGAKGDVTLAIWRLWPYLSQPKRDQIDRAIAKYHDFFVET